MEYTVENLLKLDAEGLSHSEIGKQLGKSKSAVGAKLRRLSLEGVEVRKRKHGVHPLGKHPSQKPKEEKTVPKISHNKYTIMTRPYKHKEMSKKDMYDMLKQAVENTK